MVRWDRDSCVQDEIFPQEIQHNEEIEEQSLIIRVMWKQTMLALLVEFQLPAERLPPFMHHAVHPFVRGNEAFPSIYLLC